MIHIIYEMLVLTQIHMNYLQGNIFGCFLRSITNLYTFLKTRIFFITYNDGKLRFKKKKENGDIRHLFRLKKELNYTAINDIKNLFRQKTKQLSIEYLQILGIFLSMKKKKKIIISQQE